MSGSDERVWPEQNPLSEQERRRRRGWWWWWLGEISLCACVCVSRRHPCDGACWLAALGCGWADSAGVGTGKTSWHGRAGGGGCGGPAGEAKGRDSRTFYWIYEHHDITMIGMGVGGAGCVLCVLCVLCLLPSEPIHPAWRRLLWSSLCLALDTNYGERPSWRKSRPGLDRVSLVGGWWLVAGEKTSPSPPTTEFGLPLRVVTGIVIREMRGVDQLMKLVTGSSWWWWLSR